MDHYDYIVVGAGSAGCVVAARLSEDPATSVLLIEAGPTDRHPFVHVPAAFPRLFGGPLDWADRTTPQAALGGRRVYWPRGRVLGGSSSLNAMLWLPGIAADDVTWSEIAGPLWSPEVLGRVRSRVENRLDDAGESKPGDPQGPVPVSPIVDLNPLTATFLATAAAHGLAPLRADYPTSGGETATPFSVTQRRGRRVSAADAYLKPAMRRPNLTVLTGSRARRVVFDGARATGVAVRHGRRELAMSARLEVILSAGAIGTPQLLMCSGVGPAAHLSALGIPVVADAPAVGANLQDHLTGGFVVATRRKISLTVGQRPSALLRYALFRRGPLTSPIAEAFALVRSRPGIELPDLELVFAPVAFLDEGLKVPTRHGVTLAAVLLSPESRGSVRLASPDPFVAPLIDPAYLSDSMGHDRAVLAAGVRRCQQLLTGEPLASELAEAILPTSLSGEAAVDEAIRDGAQTLYHPVGTCAMGQGEEAVLDPHCRVRHVAGLRVVDASAIPRLNHGHTNAPTIVLAERAVELVLGERAGR